MKYERFEDLPVWQAAIELGRQVFELGHAGGAAWRAGCRKAGSSPFGLGNSLSVG